MSAALFRVHWPAGLLIICHRAVAVVAWAMNPSIAHHQGDASLRVGLPGHFLYRRGCSLQCVRFCRTLLLNRITRQRQGTRSSKASGTHHNSLPFLACRLLDNMVQLVLRREQQIVFNNDHIFEKGWAVRRGSLWCVGCLPAHIMCITAFCPAI